jgi:hypothetical protein
MRNENSGRLDTHWERLDKQVNGAVGTPSSPFKVAIGRSIDADQSLASNGDAASWCSVAVSGQLLPSPQGLILVDSSTVVGVTRITRQRSLELQ